MKTCAFCNSVLSSRLTPWANYRSKHVCFRCLGQLRRLAELVEEMLKEDMPGGDYNVAPEMLEPRAQEGER